MNTAERIQTISQFFPIKKYLEVGVFNGATFNALNIPYKVAVDPNFRFDYQPLASDSVHFFQETSDAYFSREAKKEQFDLIFLDGLHEFSQTLRDFINALEHSHTQTIFIIDDVFPSDIFSAIPNQEECYYFRKMLTPTSIDGSWHGDVFKTIFAIHDFFPNISYCTVNWGFGNPQTFLFKKPRSNFQPLFNNFGAIEKLTYFDLHKHLEILNLVTEDEAFAILKIQLANA